MAERTGRDDTTYTSFWAYKVFEFGLGMGEAPGEKYKGKGLKGSLVFVVLPQAHSYCTMRYFVGLTSRDCHDFCQSHSVNGDGCSQAEGYGNDDSKTSVTNLCVHI